MKIINIFKFAMLFICILNCKSGMSTDFSIDDSKYDQSSFSNINAHSGGIIKVKNYYYWYGEFREKNNPLTQKISLYRSQDLRNWEFIKIIFNVEKSDYNIERPKIIFNEKTKNYVLWFHVEKRGDFSFSSAGNAIAKDVTTQFTDLKIIKPNNTDYKSQPFADENISKNDITNANKIFQENRHSGQMFRDMTLFKDDDKKAYIIYSSEENLTIQISRLSPNYRSFVGPISRAIIAGKNEAPSVFKRNGIYYLITSGLHGYATTLSRVFITDNLLGNWKFLGSPFVNDNTEFVRNSFKSQIAFVYYDESSGHYIFIGDQWKRGQLFNSNSLWLPIQWKDNLPSIHWIPRWQP